MREVWFWQRIVSPHMAGLAKSLSKKGCSVFYVAQDELSEDRRELGWLVPNLEGVTLMFASERAQISECVSRARSDSIHISQGFRGNGRVGLAQTILSASGHTQWVTVETPDDASWRGIAKRAIYSHIVRASRASIDGVLAIGARTPAWVADRGMPAARVFPFTYFLGGIGPQPFNAQIGEGKFRIGFVGKFIKLKRLPMLIDALSALTDVDFELVVVGSGPLGETWRRYADARLPGRVRWIGGVASTQVPEIMRSLDVLVLPSRHDGWGAVVSEALMVGTPAICSDACGASEAISASGVGGVFAAADTNVLTALISRQLLIGKVSQSRRERIAQWARCLGSDAGATYLLEILTHMYDGGPRPVAPWKNGAKASES